MVLCPVRMEINNLLNPVGEKTRIAEVFDDYSIDKIIQSFICLFLSKELRRSCARQTTLDERLYK